MPCEFFYLLLPSYRTCRCCPLYVLKTTVCISINKSANIQHVNISLIVNNESAVFLSAVYENTNICNFRRPIVIHLLSISNLTLQLFPFRFSLFSSYCLENKVNSFRHACLLVEPHRQKTVLWHIT